MEKDVDDSYVTQVCTWNKYVNFLSNHNNTYWSVIIFSRCCSNESRTEFNTETDMASGILSSYSSLLVCTLLFIYLCVSACYISIVLIVTVLVPSNFVPNSMVWHLP